MLTVAVMHGIADIHLEVLCVAAGARSTPVPYAASRTRRAATPIHSAMSSVADKACRALHKRGGGTSEERRTAQIPSWIAGPPAWRCAPRAGNPLTFEGATRGRYGRYVSRSLCVDRLSRTIRQAFWRWFAARAGGPPTLPGQGRLSYHLEADADCDSAFPAGADQNASAARD